MEKTRSGFMKMLCMLYSVSLFARVLAIVLPDDGLLLINFSLLVIIQVNSGVLSVCTAFLSGEPATRLRSQELQQLIAALLEFMAVCKRAIRVHFRLIGEEDQEFHTQLVNGFQSLTAELSHYIPAILSEL